MFVIISLIKFEFLINNISKVVKSKILEGKSYDALQIIKHSFPVILKEFPKLEFYLNVQTFIEMIKGQDQTEAIFFAKNMLGLAKNELFITIKDNKIEEINLEVIIIDIFEIIHILLSWYMDYYAIQISKIVL